MSVTAEDILAALRGAAGGFVSGEDLAASAHVSRAAVAKHIGHLRAAGHDIEGVPSQGYRLVHEADVVSARAIHAHLKESRLPFAVRTVDVTGSTNTDMMRYAQDGEHEGAVLVADRQQSGRGRMGRTWESPPGCNVYMSCLVRPPHTIPPGRAPSLTLACGVAVARTVRSQTSLTPGLKWPNDVIVNGKKLAGILLEMTSDHEGIHAIVIGIGVNVNIRREQFPEDLRTLATSVYEETGTRHARAPLIAGILNELDAVYHAFLEPEGLTALLAEWEEWAQVRGREVRVTTADGDVTGVAQGLDADGHLLITPTGARDAVRVTAGDLILVSESR